MVSVLPLAFSISTPLARLPSNTTLVDDSTFKVFLAHTGSRNPDAEEQRVPSFWVTWHLPYPSCGLAQQLKTSL